MPFFLEWNANGLNTEVFYSRDKSSDLPNRFDNYTIERIDTTVETHFFISVVFPKINYTPPTNYTHNVIFYLVS